MDGWVVGWVGGRSDGWVVGWVDGWVGGWAEGALADVDGRHLLGGEPVGEGRPLPPPPVHAHPLPGNIVGQIHLEPRTLCYLCCNGGLVKAKSKSKKVSNS